MFKSFREAFGIAVGSKLNLAMLVGTIAVPMVWLAWRVLRSSTGYMPEVFFGAADGFLGHSPEYYKLWFAPIGFTAYLVISVFMQMAESPGSDENIPRMRIDAWLWIGAWIALLVSTAVYAFWLFSGVRSPNNSVIAPILPIAVTWCFYKIGKWRVLASMNNYKTAIESTRVLAAQGHEQIYTQGALSTNNAQPAKEQAEIPTMTYADILGNRDIKRRLLDCAKKILVERAEGESPRNGILLHGEPGNGKTVFAEALAGELGIGFMPVTYGDVVSQWVGETPKNIQAVFSRAIAMQPCVLFVDEIDSMITSRDALPDTGKSSSSKHERDIVNTMLTNLVNIRKHKVVVISATNLLDSLDPAAVREGRFDFKVEITPPDQEARVGLLAHGLRKNLPKLSVNPATIDTVATRWNGFSVKRILAVTEEMPSYLADMAEKGQPVRALEFDDFMAALRRVQGRKGARPENVKPLSEMILPDQTLDAINMIASRLRDPQRVERLGGSLPHGILFYGPPGTGKTAVCKALAKDCDYAFLVRTGADLARDPRAVEKVYTEAKELRPAIIFIDEADDLIRSREMSGATEGTNKLLTLMDGIADNVKDVVWVAATNHIDQIDPALMRGGRFTEKVEFFIPEGEQLIGHIAQWLQKRKVKLSAGVSAGWIGAMLGQESIANTEAVLQYALNRAISQSSTDVVELGMDDLQAGCRVVLGAA